MSTRGTDNMKEYAEKMRSKRMACVDEPQQIDPRHAAVVSAAPELYELLAQIEITECAGCNGTGKTPRTDDDACRECGGSGEVCSRLFSGDVRAALARATAKE